MSRSGDTTEPGGGRVEVEFPEQFVDDIFSRHQAGAPNSDQHTTRFLDIHGFIYESSQAMAFYEEYDVPTYTLGPGSVRVLWESPLRAFYQNFWEGEIYDAWRARESVAEFQDDMMENYASEFVSRRAAAFPGTDFRETLLRFILEDSIPELGDFNGSEKVISFWNEPDFVELRDYARAAF